MPKKKVNQKKINKIKTVLKEYKEGTLNIGKSTKKVKSRKQAIAIAISVADKLKKKGTKKKRKK